MNNFVKKKIEFFILGILFLIFIFQGIEIFKLVKNNSFKDLFFFNEYPFFKETTRTLQATPSPNNTANTPNKNEDNSFSKIKKIFSLKINKSSQNKTPNPKKTLPLLSPSISPSPSLTPILHNFPQNNSTPLPVISSSPSKEDFPFQDQKQTETNPPASPIPSYQSLAFAETFSNDYFFDRSKTNLFWSYSLSALILPPSISYSEVSNFSEDNLSAYCNASSSLYLVGKDNKIFVFNKTNPLVSTINLDFYWHKPKEIIVNQTTKEKLVLDEANLYFLRQGNSLGEQLLTFNPSGIACDESYFCLLASENSNLDSPDFGIPVKNLGSFKVKQIKIPFWYKKIKLVYSPQRNSFFIVGMNNEYLDLFEVKKEELNENLNFQSKKIFIKKIKYFEKSYLKIEAKNNYLLFGYWSDKPETFAFEFSTGNFIDYSSFFPARLVELYKDSIIFNQQVAFSPFEQLKSEVDNLKYSSPNFIFLIPCLEKNKYYLLFDFFGKTYIYKVKWDGFKNKDSFLAFSKDFIALEGSKTNQTFVKGVYLDVFDVLKNKAEISLSFSNNSIDFFKAPLPSGGIYFKTTGKNLFWKIKVIPSQDNFSTPIIRLINFTILIP